MSIHLQAGIMVINTRVFLLDRLAAVVAMVVTETSGVRTMEAANLGLGN